MQFALPMPHNLRVTGIGWRWFLFFCTCLFIEWKAARETGVSARSIVIKQVQHWLGLLAAVYLTFYLFDFGRLDNESTGLILLLVLSQHCFVV